MCCPSHQTPRPHHRQNHSAPDEDDDDGSATATASADGEGSAEGAAAAAPEEPYKAAKKRWDEAKAALLEALRVKLEAQLDAADAAEAGGGGGGGGESGASAAVAAAAALATSAELRRWVDTAAAAAYVLLHARVEARAGRLAGALKALDKAEKNAEDDGKAPRKEAAEQRAALLARLGWAHWAAYEKARMRVRFPGAFPPM